MNTLRKGALTALILSLAFPVAHAQPGRQTERPDIQLMVLTQASAAPKIDGNLGDPAWKGMPFRGFRRIEDGAAAAQQTEAAVTYDANNLYLGVKCLETNLAGLTTQVKDRDGEVWKDDCIEFLLDTANAHHTCYHFIVNSVGALYDEKCLSTERADPSWNSKTIVKTGRTKDAWTLEMAIPLRDLGVTAAPGIKWGMNVCRARYAGDKEWSAWSHTPDGFVQPKDFGHVMLTGASPSYDGPRLESWGNLDRDMSFGGRNVLTCTFQPKSSDTWILKLVGKDGQKTTVNARQVVRAQPGKPVTIEMPYSPAGTKTESFTFTVTSGKQVLMKATHPSQAIPPTPRVWQLSDPLFTELLSKTLPGLQKDGSIYWFHSGIDSALRPFGKEYGIRYSDDEAFKELVDNKLMPIVQSRQLVDDRITSMAKKHGFKVFFDPDYRGSATKGVPVLDGLPFTLDPRSREVFFSDLKKGIADGRQYIWGIYTQDELHEKAGVQGVGFFSKMKDSYPYIREVDAEVRERFGYGKYGIPESESDTNPYRWIAYHKWINAQLLQWQKDVYAYVKKTAPEIKVVSMDPVAGHKPYDLDRVGPYIDIATHQLYPSSNPNRQEFGFVTKFVADLTGKPVWPCTHVENYAYSTTAEEVRELMSQVMRNGGKGFHLYIPDVRGNGANYSDTRLTKIGCPERYRAIMEILKTSRSMNEVAVPTDADCAILYSEDHYQSFPGKNYVYPNDVEYCYTFLGPVARTWFDIINDNMVADGKDLSKYKAIFVPAAKYERRSVVEKLVKYAENGGVLVFSDTHPFVSAPDGSSLADICTGLTPSMIAADERFPIEHKFGKGRTFIFCDAFTEKNIGDEGYQTRFRALAKDLGLKTDRSIWRFKFPEFKTVYQPDPTGRCLTGNYVKWHQEKPLDILNVKTGGLYAYSVAPDADGDPGATFDKGDLTDRKDAPAVLKSQLKPEDFVVSWKTETPLTTVFDFRKAYPLSRVHLWYSDQLPALTVEGSTDGKKWVRMASNPKQAPTKDVLDVELKVQGTYRYVRLSLGQRDAGQMMTLVECEVWAK